MIPDVSATRGRTRRTACSTPAAITQGVTFDDLVDILRRDRNSLQDCTMKFTDLANAVAGCNSLIDTHDATVRAIDDPSKQ